MNGVYIEQTFDRVEVTEALGHPSSLEFLVVPNVAACVLVHTPIGASSGLAAPVGFASFDPPIVERVQSCVLDTTLRYVGDETLRSEIEQGLAKSSSG